MLVSENVPHAAQNHLAQFAPVANHLKSLAEAQALSGLLLGAAQAEYDKWDESDEDTYAGGGICHLIAEEMVGVLDTAGIEAAMVSSTHEQHVYVACKLATGVYTLDIPYSIYERGSMFTWWKIHGVKFDVSCLVWYRVDPDPEGYEQYID